MYAFQESEPASRPPPVSFSPPKAPPISAPLVPILTLAIPQSLPAWERKFSTDCIFFVNIDEDKFDHEQENEFKVRDKYVDHYHTISNKTYHQLKQITKKPITEIPWWVNQNIWFDINDKQYIYDKFRLPEDKYLIGSFQRDTEGYDLKSPKLYKGPDRLIENIMEIQAIKNNVLVILAGKRRQYVIEK